MIKQPILTPPFIDLLENGDSSKYLMPKYGETKTYSMSGYQTATYFFSDSRKPNNLFTGKLENVISEIRKRLKSHGFKPTHIIVPTKLENQRTLNLQSETIISCPYLTDPDDWYLISDPDLQIATTFQPDQWRRLNWKRFIKVIN